ncbi:MAG TPA: biotin synthase [Burkholderiaceae bacterium]
MSEGPAVDPAALHAHWRRLARAAAPPWLHGEVARRMAERLPVIRAQPATIVQWPGWSGASDALLAAAYPKARRVLAEPTPALAEHARARRPRWWPRARAGAEAVADAEIGAASAELLWSNMALHFSADPQASFAHWQRALAVGGFVMFSCFGPDTLKALRALYARLGWGAPAQDFVDMHDLGDMLLHAGFADPVMDQETLTLTFADAASLLDELRGLGGNAAPARHAGLRTPRWRARLLDSLEALRGADGRLALGFEIVYGHAFKTVARGATGETQVSLDAMRGLVRASRTSRR